VRDRTELESTLPATDDELGAAFDAIDGDLESVLDGVDEEIDALRDQSRYLGWVRLEYAIIAGLVLLFGAYAVAYIVLGVDLDGLKSWGYVGIFFIAMAGSATIVLPTPSTVAIFGGGIVLDPVLGIPAPLMVGLVAGLGDAIGEFSGYGLGYAGTNTLRHRRVFRTFEGWMKRRGMLTIFALSTFPNPFFDLVGAAAGSTRMPARRFFLATLAGKTVKDVFLAYGGSFSAGLVGGWV
jgi:membrane protein YqaA with SNARE-associated domain